MAWFVYVARCGDGTLYTGVTTDPAARERAHNSGRGAAYTRSRLPVSLVHLEPAAGRGAALRRERAIKRLTRKEKEAMVVGHTAAARFAGFRPEALGFLRRLKRNNRREWFERNRAVYETEVRDPMRALVEEMDVRLARLAPELTGDPRHSIFRIHRDVRFSADKSPYKTNAACQFYHQDAGRGAGQDAQGAGAGLYFQLARWRVLRGRRDVDAGAAGAGADPRGDRRDRRRPWNACCARPRSAGDSAGWTTRRCSSACRGVTVRTIPPRTGCATARSPRPG